MKSLSRSLALVLSLLGACGVPEPVVAPQAVGVVGIDEVRYTVPATEAWKAAEMALSGESFKIQWRRRYDCGGKIVATRSGGYRVTVTVHAPERSASEVSISAEPPDRELVGKIQARIGANIGGKLASADLFGNTSSESSYEIPLDTAIVAAERTCGALSLEVIFKRVDRDRGRLDAVDRAGRPARFYFHKVDGSADETGLILTTETAADGGEKDFLRNVRKEFERHIYVPSE
jgi:hypothetical protein